MKKKISVYYSLFCFFCASGMMYFSCSISQNLGNNLSIDVCQALSADKMLVYENNKVIYAFLDARMKEFTKYSLYIGEPPNWKVFNDEESYFFVRDGIFNISVGMLKQIESTSEFMSILIHEFCHFVLDKKKNHVFSQSVKNIICTDKKAYELAKFEFAKNADWIAIEKRTDSITMIALADLNYYPKAYGKLLLEKSFILNIECRQNMDRRVILMNKIWVSEGMPSSNFRKEEYQKVIATLP